VSPHPNPWSDPATETEPGDPYAGPPPTVPYRPAPGWPPATPYGTAWPHPWPPPPARPQRPAQVVAAAVLVLVQAAGVALASAYLRLLGSVFSMAADEPGFPADAAALAAEAGVLAVVQLLSVVVLVAAGVLALTSRHPLARWALGAACALQLALAGYWAARLLGAFGSASGLLPFVVLCAAAAPAVALGLSVGRPARAWFGGRPDGGTTPHR
jgi:hypothetical protein